MLARNVGRISWAIPPTAAVEKTTRTASKEAAMLRSVHVDWKRCRKVFNPSLIGLLLIFSSSTTVAIKKMIVNAVINERRELRLFAALIT